MVKRNVFSAALGLAIVLLVIAWVSAATGDGFGLGWHLIGSGGGDAASPDYALSGSAGQSSAGALSSADYQLSTGYWAGADAESLPPVGEGTYVYLPVVLSHHPGP
jgi:hypothetical protein